MNVEMISEDFRKLINMGMQRRAETVA